MADMPAYLALAAEDLQEGGSPENIQFLTPLVMKWCDGVWLFDLGPCRSYWQLKAHQQGLDWAVLVRDVITAVFGQNDYQAALAEHPWQALLAVMAMKERELSGVMDLASSFGRGFFQQTSWSAWWSCCEEIARHFTDLQRKGFKASTFREQSLRMQQMVERLGAKKPADLLRALGGEQWEAIGRRFGVVMRELWQWAYGAEDPQSKGGFLALSLLPEFPWRLWEPELKPSVVRHLDYPVYEWEQMAPLLREDFDRLCALDSWTEKERVMSLEWRLVLHSLNALLIPVSFRHPHSLHREKGYQRTALLQALYSFERDIPGSFLDPARIDELLPVEPVVGWELVVKERLILPEPIAALFDDDRTDEADVIHLENKLPLSLNGYVLCSDWLPEDSFAEARKRAGAMLAHDHPYLPSYLITAKHRPLFLYDEAFPLRQEQGSGGWRFLERTMDKWWQADVRRPRQRDYYSYLDKDNRNFWVFRDQGGEWFVHGIFA